jgi:integrase
MRQQITIHRRRNRGLEPYGETVAHWRRLSGNPTIGETAREHCETFVRLLFRLPGRRGPKTPFRWSARRHCWLRLPKGAQAKAGDRLLPRISQNTVRKLCGQMEMLFRWAGAPSKRFRDAADLFVGLDAAGHPRRVPWLDSPPKAEGAERVFTRDELVAWVGACRWASAPQIEGVLAADWWRALIRVIYYTGLRIGSALAARYSWIVQREGDCWLEMPAQAMKAKRAEPICLKAAAVAALDSIRRPGRDLIFAWPWPPSGSHRALYQECERLQDLAGIPPQRRFRFHAIRACAGDVLYELNPEMAREALCHKDLRTTMESYTAKTTRRRRRAAAAAMPELTTGEGQRTLFEK